MNPTAIIREAAADGVRLTPTERGTLKTSGPAAAVSRWLPQLRAHKAAIIEALTVGTDTTASSFDDELLQERAAIYKFDAGFSRQEAEARAMKEMTWTH